jgi:hypothetical protein
MRCLLPDLLPQELDGIEVRRIGWQLVLGQAVSVRSKELGHQTAGMILGAILNKDKMLCRLGQRVRQESSVALGIETARLALPKEATGDVVNQAKDFVGLALAAGLDRGLVPPECPGVAQGTPLREARSKVTEDQVLYDDCCPAPRGIARCFWAGNDQVSQLLSVMQYKQHILRKRYRIGRGDEYKSSWWRDHRRLSQGSEVSDLRSSEPDRQCHHLSACCV